MAESQTIQRTPSATALPSPEMPQSLLKRSHTGAHPSSLTPDACPIQQGLQSPSQALDAQTRQVMESRFNHDFSQVRVHTNSQASASAQIMNARAYTLGHHVVFANGYYTPETLAGKRLLAHELTHVIQQQSANEIQAQSQLDISQPTDAAEQEARTIATQVTDGKTVQVRHRTGAALHRDTWDWLGPTLGVVGGLAAIGGIAYGIYALLNGENSSGRASSEVPDLPAELAERLRPAITSDQANVRQTAIDALADWARRTPSLGIQWERVVAIRYDPASDGSMTDANDPMNIHITLGRDAFSSVSNLYSTFRHELVHVVQHHDQQQATSRGLGWQEVNAYLWELENAQATGLAQPENWGIRPDGTANTSVGLARVVDGLLRNISRLGGELQENPNAVPQDELDALSSRIACALLATPWEVVHAVNPDLERSELQSACHQTSSS